MKVQACLNYADDLNKTFISNDEYERLTVQNDNLENAISNAVAEEQAKAQQAKTLQLQHQAEIADIKASLETAKNQIEFLTVQNESLMSQLRKASDDAVKIAQANSAVVNVESNRK